VSFVEIFEITHFIYAIIRGRTERPFILLRMMCLANVCCHMFGSMTTKKKKDVPQPVKANGQRVIAISRSKGTILRELLQVWYGRKTLFGMVGALH